jgi:DNA (cytosine-5)-methyltransferase 1
MKRYINDFCFKSNYGTVYRYFLFLNQNQETKLAIYNAKKTFTFIDLFAGIGGTRLGFEQACFDAGIKTKCVFTSEIKEYAISVYKDNFPDSEVNGDITKIPPTSIPNFDYLLAGFPCQPFSSAGKRKGFLDERGGLFFTIHKILDIKKPQGFLLENVDGLANHDKGKTLDVIISKLESLGYQVSWKILDASNFGIPQKRWECYSRMA